MPPTNGILESSLYVADLDRSAQFYQHLFGFPLLGQNDRMAVLHAAEHQVLLLFKKGASQHLPKVPHDGDGQLHLAFAIAADQLQPWRDWLRQNAVAIEDEPRMGAAAAPACTSATRTTISSKWPRPASGRCIEPAGESTSVLAHPISRSNVRDTMMSEFEPNPVTKAESVNEANPPVVPEPAAEVTNRTDAGHWHAEAGRKGAPPAPAHPGRPVVREGTRLDQGPATRPPAH